ncbi:MAG: hypothetical protein JXB10_19795, partial [Pirellulales bacterium]|nr:hypothetical protein [Pirellulales bacterium]
MTARSTPYQFKQIEDDKTLTITGTGTVTIYTQFVFRPALITLAAGSELIVHAGQALQLQLPAAPGDPGAFITPHQLHFVIDTTNAPAGEPAATIDFKTIQRGDIAAQSPDGLKILDASGSKGKSKGGMGGDVIVMANGAGISGTIHALGGDAVGYSSNSGGDGGNGGTIAVAVTTITNTLHLDTSGGKGSYGMGMYSVTTPGGTGGNGGAISMEIVNSVNSSLINAKADGGWGGVGGCGTFGTDIQGLYWPDENHDPDDSLVPHAGDGGNGGKGGRGGGIGRIDIKADGKSISFPTKPGNGGSGGRGGFGGRVLPPDNNYVGYPGNGGQGGMGGDAGGPGALPGFGGLGGDAGALWWDNVPWIVGLEGSDGLPGTYPANPLPPPHYVSPPVMPEQDDWTIMVYVAGDSQRNCQPDIQQALAIALDRLEDVDLGNVPINVVMQMDRYDASLPGDFTWPTPFCNPESRRGWITYDGVKDSIRSVFLPVTIGNNPNSSADRNNSSASYTLQNFIQWAVGEAPAEHYALILQGHGAGIVGLLEDNTSNDIMGLRRVGAAIEGAGLSRPIDVVAVQCCNEQIVELATELRGKALYVVGSQWPLDYCEIDGNFTSGNRWLGWLRNHPHASASDLTGKMVSVYGTLWNMITFLWELKAQTYSTLDMTKMPMLISAVKAFVDTADTCIGKDSSIISDLERIRNITREDNPQQQVDLGVFMYKVATDPILKAKQPIDQPGSLCYSAWATYNQAKKLVIQRGGWLTWSHTGISVFFPKKNHDQARILYPPFDGAGGYNATNFQFVAETRWDDFLRHLIPSPPPPSASSTPTVCSKATANPFPDLEGTVVDPTATVQVTVAGHTYDAINKDDGTWALPGTALVAPLAEGTYEVVAIAYDINGNMVGEPGKGELIIDFHQPASDMYPLPDISPTKDFVLSWSGADNENGSGIAHLEIYVSDNNGPLSLWLINAAETPVVFYGQSGHHYAFYSVAVDLAGNAETLPAVPDAVTTVEIGSTAIWSGIGADDHWTTAANWIGDIAPSPGDVLLFSANSAQLKSVNNYPAGTVFGEIIVCGSGYQIEGEVAS